MRVLRILVVLLSMACASPAGAQAPVDPTARIAELEQQVARYLRLLGDWGGLTRYGSANAELGPARPEERRVVFIGDDITEAWSAGAAPFFPGQPYVNRGIARQTTAQMLVRFRQDVIALRPSVVVIATELGLEAKSSTPQELATLLKESYDRWGPIVKKIGFTADS